MTITASSAQIGQTPTRSSSSETGSMISDTLSQSAQTSSARVSSAEEILFAPTLFGTLTADCTASIEVSINGSAFCLLSGASWTNAELQANTAKLVKLTTNISYRIRLSPGTMTGSNGITMRHRN